MTITISRDRKKYVSVKHGIRGPAGTTNASNITSGTLALARGGTGASLTDPGADRLLFWDESANSTAFLTLGTGLSITGTTIDASASGGTWGGIGGTLSSQTDLQTALDAKASTASLTSHTGNTSNPHSVTAAQVGLGSVENTALSTWAGSASITTLGTITTGVWNATIGEQSLGSTFNTAPLKYTGQGYSENFTTPSVATQPLMQSAYWREGLASYTSGQTGAITRNNVKWRGFNIVGPGSPIVSGQPMLWESIEGSYDPGAVSAYPPSAINGFPWFEWHQSYAGPDGAEKRLSSYTIQPTTNNVHWDLRFSNVSMFDLSGNSVATLARSSGAAFYGSSPVFRIIDDSATARTFQIQIAEGAFVTGADTYAFTQRSAASASYNSASFSAADSHPGPLFSGLNNGTTYIASWPNSVIKNRSTTTNALNITHLTNNSGTSVSAHGAQVLNHTTGESDYVWFLTTSAGAVSERLRLKSNGTIGLDRTITTAGTTGAQTINKAAGTVNAAAAATSLVVTNSTVTTSSLVFCTIRTNDATAVVKSVVPASGSFTINLTAPTAETSIGFLVLN